MKRYDHFTTAINMLHAQGKPINVTTMLPELERLSGEAWDAQLVKDILKSPDARYQISSLQFSAALQGVKREFSKLWPFRLFVKSR